MADMGSSVRAAVKAGMAWGAWTGPGVYAQDLGNRSLRRRTGPTTTRP
jgi:hypothetical protein